jgi:hypothetical protein
MSGEQAGQPRDQKPAEGGGTTDANQPRWRSCSCPDRRFGFGPRFEGLAAALVELASFIREAQVTGRPIYQRAQMLFESKNLFADG